MNTSVGGWWLFSRFAKDFTPKLITSLRQGYSWDFLQKDAFAGLSVAIVAFPLAMALAVASGTTPDRGIATAIIGGFIIAALGGSRTQIGGPAAAFAVVIFNVIQNHGYDGLLLATFMGGIFLVIAGFARLGSIIKYVPYSVIIGFTAGLALVIFTSQLRDFFGLPIENLPTEFAARWQVYWHNSWNLDWQTMTVAMVSLLGIIIIRKKYPRIPVLLFVVCSSSLCVWFFQLDITTIGSKFGDIPASLPYPQIPTWSFEKIISVLPAALTIAFLAGIESLLCAVIADSMTGDHHRSNAELIGQGVANMVVPFFGGIPVTATFARTATNIKAGAQTPIAGIMHAIFVLIFMTFFAKLAGYIPLATLAAILVMVSWDMSDLNKFIRLLKSADSERIVLLATFGLTVLTDLTIAIQAGIIISSFFFVQRMSRLTRITTPDDEDNQAPQPSDLPESVKIYHVRGPIFFGAASRIKSVLDRQGKGSTQEIYILNLKHMPLIDATGVHILTHFIEKCHRQGTTVIISGLNPQPAHTLLRMESRDIVPINRQTKTLDQAIRLSHTLLNAVEDSQPTIEVEIA
ncbi:MAG: SulP family inorganic anion transporter [Alphaproteobacteria bacterium]